MPLARQVARALLFDDQDRMLFVHWRDPVTGREFLEPPGGRVEEGESFEDAIKREVAEEAGLVGVEVKAFVGEGNQTFTFAGQGYCSHEHYFACEVSGTETCATALDPLEQTAIVGVEWVRLADVADYPMGFLEPPDLLEMLQRLGRIS